MFSDRSKRDDVQSVPQDLSEGTIVPLDKIPWSLFEKTYGRKDDKVTEGVAAVAAPPQTAVEAAKLKVGNFNKNYRREARGDGVAAPVVRQAKVEPDVSRATGQRVEKHRPIAPVAKVPAAATARLATDVVPVLLSQQPVVMIDQYNCYFKLFYPHGVQHSHSIVGKGDTARLAIFDAINKIKEITENPAIA